MASFWAAATPSELPMETIADTRKYAGCVLDIEEENGRDDSDFYAIVWDEDTQSVQRIKDGTTRYAAPSQYHAADASEAIIAKAKKWAIEVYLPKYALMALEKEAKRIDFDVQVRVIGGRKLPVGTEGEVFWVGSNSYYRAPRYCMNGLGYRPFDPKSKRVGIRLADGSRHYLGMDQVVRINVKTFTKEEILQRARQMYTNWRTMFSVYFLLQFL